MEEAEEGLEGAVEPLEAVELLEDEVEIVVDVEEPVRRAVRKLSSYATA